MRFVVASVAHVAYIGWDTQEQTMTRIESIHAHSRAQAEYDRAEKTRNCGEVGARRFEAASVRLRRSWAALRAMS